MNRILNLKAYIIAKIRGKLLLRDKKIAIYVFKISKYRTQLMGLAAIWVLGHHIFTELYDSVSIPVISQIFARGNIGVDIFLIVSGMGLFVSVSKKSNITEFYKKRFIKVVMPWILMSVPYWSFIYVLQKNNSFVNFFYDLLGISFWTDGISTTWYVEFIILMYLLYPIIYKIQKKNLNYIKLAIIMAILVNFIVYFFFTEWYIKVDKALMRVPAFLIGSVLGELLFEKERKEECTNIITIYALMTTIIFLLSPFIRKINHEFGIMMYFLGAFGIAFILITIASWILDLQKGSLLNNVLIFIGKMSLEVYLMNVFVRNIIVELGIGMNASNDRKICIMLLTSFFIVGISWIYSKLDNTVANIVKRKLIK